MNLKEAIATIIYELKNEPDVYRGWHGTLTRCISDEIERNSKLGTRPLKIGSKAAHDFLSALSAGELDQYTHTEIDEHEGVATASESDDHGGIG